MISVIKLYREGYILYDICEKKYVKLSHEDYKIIQAGIIEEDGNLKKIKITPSYNQSTKLKDYEYIFIDSKTPLKVFWDITEACNARCIHCFTNSGEKAEDELTTEQVFMVIDQLVSYGIMSIAFSGGEPLIRNDFISILKYASDKGVAISFTTNGTLLDIDKIKNIIELQPKSITVSLDAISQEVSGRIRKAIDVKKVMENIMIIAQCAKDKDIQINVRTTLNKLNIGEIYYIYKFCINSKIDCFKINNTNIWGRAKDYPNLRLDDKEFLNALLYIQEKATNHNCRVELPIEKYLNNEQLYNGRQVCTSTIDTINIFANGDIGPCGFCERKLLLGNIIQDGIEKIFASALPFDFHNEICENCNIHKYSDGEKKTNTRSFIN